MKFIEFGFGNRWFVRMETELNNGTEFEEKGIVLPIRLHSLYLRIWIWKTVVILDSKEGYKRTNKNRSDFKLLIGMRSL
ncbi:DUF3977 family protein [Fictibacillus sp. BK138]|uniref:DUF3977 family protein n=1 Tax=Fictibacillus sp. BK138 TaxID=2512121 RepID=UPI00102957F5|nr:DUF3977 family protein [Fictibacillus sp. BK138]RZT23840.1 uncharacterized protein DUF3977 [Fictibacillus sp. BK138]